MEPNQDEVLTLLRDIAARLARIESARVVKSNRNAAVEPLRVSRNQAAQMLGVSRASVDKLAARGLLVRLPKRPGAGRTTPTYFDPANVRALAESEEAAKAWIAGRKYLPRGKRP